MPRDSAWRDWYRAQHDRRCQLTGNAFEDYVTSGLARFHDDFINPTPAGTLGDGGCDGLAEAGTILYACYGARAMRDAERKLRDKMRGDFTRALSKWSSFTTWRFVTNAPAGPEAASYIVEIQQEHGKSADRPIKPTIWDKETLWFKVIGTLREHDLDDLFPGVPRANNIELIDMVPLLDALGETSRYIDSKLAIRPVPSTKMSFNKLSASARLELNEGRLSAPRIDRWFEDQAEPDLSDQQGQNFRRIYQDQLRVTTNPSEVLERMYTALGGSDFRHDAKRANAVYAVTSYFFDSCHIFEEPPADYIAEDAHATAN